MAETLNENRELANNAYRISVMGHFVAVPSDPKCTEDIKIDGTTTVSYQQDKCLYSVKMRMPDGSTECWRQTDSVFDQSNGFKAVAFERRKDDGSLYLDPSGRPQVMMMFLGNSFTKPDVEHGRKLVYGESMQDYFEDREKFVKRVEQGMLDRADYDRKNGQPHALPVVTVGGHSMGTTAALGAALQLKEGGFGDSKTILLEPVGAGQALQQLSLYYEDRYVGSRGRGQVSVMASAIAQNVTSIRADNDNIFHGNTGYYRNGNAMIGETYTYAAEKGPLSNIAGGHSMVEISNSMLRNGEKGLVRTPEKDIDPVKIVEGGGVLSIEQTKAAQRKADLFGAAMGVIKSFNQAAAFELSARADQLRTDFAKLILPEPKHRSILAMNNVVSVPNGQ